MFMFPSAWAFCPYCDFYSLPIPRKKKEQSGAGKTEAEFPKRDLDIIRQFAGGLKREWRLLRAAHAKEFQARALKTLYFGGGTPSVMPAASLRGILRFIANTITIAAHAEITLEANPETFTSARRPRRLARNGIQSPEPGRAIHEAIPCLPPSAAATAFRRPAVHFNPAREAGFENISIDLMFGLPGQSLADWMEAIEQSIAWRPRAYFLLWVDDSSGATPFAPLAKQGRPGIAPGRNAGANVSSGRGVGFFEAGYEQL